MGGRVWRVVNCQSCYAPIVWALVGRGSARIPLDAEPPLAGGQFFLAWDRARDKNPRAFTVPMARRFGRTDLLTSHLKTCPQAQLWRERAEEGRHP